LVENISYFSEYPMRAIEEIASRLDQKTFEYKDIILKEGDPSSELFIIY